MNLHWFETRNMKLTNFWITYIDTNSESIGNRGNCQGHSPGTRLNVKSKLFRLRKQLMSYRKQWQTLYVELLDNIKYSFIIVPGRKQGQRPLLNLHWFETCQMK